MPDKLNISLSAIEQAAHAIDPAFLASPEIALPRELVRRVQPVRLKLETLNPVRSFKGRGGDWLALGCQPDEVLVCASAGNLGQGIAYGARRHGRTVHVTVPHTANPIKLRRIRDLGAHVHLVDGDFDDAKARAVSLAVSRGWRLVEDGSEPALAEGAATVATEVARRHGESLGCVVVPVGNGSLACGVGTWLRAVSPGTRIIGVGSASAPATRDAWRTGVPAAGPAFQTVAEGLCARIPVAGAVEVLRSVLDEFVLVDESRLVEAARVLWGGCGVLTEPSAAATAAAAFQWPELLGDGIAVLVISGANASADLLNRILTAEGPPIEPSGEGGLADG